MTYELVLPARFAEYMEGTHLLQTRDAQGDSDGVSVLEVWDNSTLRRGQRVLTIDFDQDGRGVLNYIREYGETVVWAGTAEYTRGERTAARKVLERIAEINAQYRAAKRQKEAEPVAKQPQETYVTVNFSPRTDKITEDGTELTQVPYPFHVNMDGTVRRQDFWQGDPLHAVGFVQRVEDRVIKVSWGQFARKPQPVTGMYLVTADVTGQWSTHEVAVSEVTVVNPPSAVADDTETDVHTEHCCSIHGCKYGDTDCTVKTGTKKQSYPCPYCDDEDEEFLRGFAEGKKKVLQTIRENIDVIFGENLPMAACELAIRWLNEYMEENE